MISISSLDCDPFLKSFHWYLVFLSCGESGHYQMEFLWHLSYFGGIYFVQSLLAALLVGIVKSVQQGIRILLSLIYAGICYWVALPPKPSYFYANGGSDDSLTIFYPVALFGSLLGAFLLRNSKASVRVLTLRLLCAYALFSIIGGLSSPYSTEYSLWAFGVGLIAFCISVVD